MPHATLGFAVDANQNVFVTDVGNGTVNGLTAANNYETVSPVGNGFFTDPYGLALDGNGSFYVTDPGSSSVREGSPLDGFTTVSTPG